MNAFGTMLAFVVAAVSAWAAYQQTKLTRRSVELAEVSVKLSEQAFRAASDPVVTLSRMTPPQELGDRRFLIRTDLLNSGGSFAEATVTIELAEGGLDVALGRQMIPKRSTLPPHKVATFDLYTPRGLYEAIKGGDTLKVTVRVRYRGGTMKEAQTRLFVGVYDPSVSKEMNLITDEGMAP